MVSTWALDKTECLTYLGYLANSRLARVMSSSDGSKQVVYDSQYYTKQHIHLALSI